MPSKVETKRLARMFRALSNPNRLQLYVNLFRESELDLARGQTHQCFLANILKNLNVGAPTVSHHVRELESAGLITTERQGKQLTCALNPEGVALLRSFFGAGR